MSSVVWRCWNLAWCIVLETLLHSPSIPLWEGWDRGRSLELMSGTVMQNAWCVPMQIQKNQRQIKTNHLCKKSTYIYIYLPMFEMSLLSGSRWRTLAHLESRLNCSTTFRSMRCQLDPNWSHWVSAWSMKRGHKRPPPHSKTLKIQNCFLPLWSFESTVTRLATGSRGWHHTLQLNVAAGSSVNLKLRTVVELNSNSKLSSWKQTVDMSLSVYHAHHWRYEWFNQCHFP